MRNKKNLGKVAIAVASALGLITAAIGALHIPQIQALFGARCPIPMASQQVDPVERHARRERAHVFLRGEGEVAVRAAGEFELLVSTKDEIMRSAQQYGWNCEAGKGDAGLQCQREDRDVRLVRYFDFDLRERLVSSYFMEYYDDPQRAAKSLQTQHSAVESLAGAPSERVGHATADYLASGTWRQARSSFQRSDYYASLSATQISPDRYLVASQYVGIP